MHVRPRAPGPHRLALTLGMAFAVAGIVAAPQPAAAAEPDFPAKDSRYHNLVEMTAEVNKAAADHPDIVRVFTIGKSYQGRPIIAAKVSDNPNKDEAEPEVLIDALHHAREHLTTEQALALLRWLTDDYGRNDTITRLVNGREIFIIFALNPDGFRYDLTGNPYRAWRKNRQPNSGTTAVGTDLNRNYDYKWACCGGSSGSKSSITYRGPKPFSAPETRALRDFVNGRVVDGRQQIRTHVTLHTNGQLILWPYGYTKADLPADMSREDLGTFRIMGRAMAAKNGYRAMQSSDLYITDGDQIDWMYGRHRIFSFTFELYPPETPTVWGDHYPPDERIATQTARNRGALLHLIDRAVCPYRAISTYRARINCGPLFDDFEINRGWKVDPYGTDTASRGVWERHNPEGVYYRGAKQPNLMPSGRYALVTGRRAGSSAHAYDLDGGVTTVRSEPVNLPGDAARYGPLTFRVWFAHGADSSPDDGLAAYVETEDGTLTEVWSLAGAATDRDGAWTTPSVSLAAFAGQRIRLVFVAKDAADESLVEAVVDDVRIQRPG